MFLNLGHTGLEVYQASYQLTLSTYKVTKLLPDAERFNLTSQIRRAALSVHLNIAEGSSRSSAIERKRFYEIARGSLIEVDSAIGVTFGLEYVSGPELSDLGALIVETFKILSGLIKNTA